MRNRIGWERSAGQAPGCILECKFEGMVWLIKVIL